MNVIAAHRETISGAVLPHRWDADYSVTGVVLSCQGEREIEVDNLHEVPGLLDLLRSRATLTGTVVFSGGREAMRVERYTAL